MTTGDPVAAGDPIAPEVVHFGGYTFDLTALRLARDNVDVHLTPKAAAVLGHLLRRPGELIAKDEFLESVWAGMFAREESLTQAISIIRQALGDSAKSPRFIQTVSGEGYRFIGKIRETDCPAAIQGPSDRSEAPGSEDAVAGAPEGRRKPVYARPRALLAATLAVVLIAIAWALSTGDAPQDGSSIPATAAAPEASFTDLVILANADIGSDIDQQRFAVGVGEELSTKLAGVMSGEVVPYSVVMRADLSDKTLPQIADQFDVAFVLELSVRWANGADSPYLLSATLWRTSDEALIWQDSYRGELNSTEIFDQQAELANGVLQALAITLPVGERQIVAAWPTPSGNLQAWKEYLIGMELLRAPPQERDKWGESIPHFERALELDPDYVVVQAMLSRAYARAGNEEQRARAGRLAQALVAHHGDLPQAQWALGEHYYHLTTRGHAVADRQRYYTLAVEHLRKARDGLPYDPDVEFMLALVGRRQGEWATHTALFEKALRRQPENLAVLGELAASYVVTREHERADELLDRYLELVPQALGPHVLKTYNHLAWDESLSRLHAYLDGLEVPQAATCPWYLPRILAEAADRDFRELIRQRDRVRDCTTVWIGNMSYSLDLYAALAHRELGMEREARSRLEVAREYYEEGLHENPNLHGMHATLGLIHAMLGERADALHHANTAMEMRPMSQDAFQGSEPVQFYIRTLAQLGEPGDVVEAIDQLEGLLSIPATVTIPYVLNDPFMDPLAAHPRFRELVQRYPTTN